MSEIMTFESRQVLEDKLLTMNYDDGVNPELACVDGHGQVFLACGTEQGDCMGIAYYLTNADGYMYHYGTEEKVDQELLQWIPAFPVVAIGA